MRKGRHVTAIYFKGLAASTIPAAVGFGRVNV
jgi:hypothetical protein